MFKEKLVIDIMKRNYSKIQCLIGDTLELDIDILANGVPFDIESFDILIEQGLDNGNFNIQNTKIIKNKNNFICALSNKFTSIKGEHFIDVSIIKNDYKKTTFKIPFNVYEGAIQEDSNEQEIFISILSEIKEEIIKAEEIKIELDSKIKDSDGAKASLSGVVNTANTTKEDLISKTTEANNSKNNLNGAINTANTIKEDLILKTTEANNAKNSLNEVITTANTTKNSLTTEIEEAKRINSNLSQSIANGDVAQLKTDINRWNNFEKNGGDIGSKSGMNIGKESISRTAGSLYLRGRSNGNDGIYVNNTNINPEQDLRISLGTSDRRWSSLWLGSYIKSDKGYNMLPNGFIEQYGTVTESGSGGSGEISVVGWYNTAFPNRLINVQLTIMCNHYDKGKFTDLYVIESLDPNRNERETFEVYAKYNSPGPWTCKIFWRALGY